MAASSHSLSAIGGAVAPRQSLYDQLNGPWHERALQFFMLIVLTHWAEHFAQAYQVFVMGWPLQRRMAFWAYGIRGLSSPRSCIMLTSWLCWLACGYCTRDL